MRRIRRSRSPRAARWAAAGLAALTLSLIGDITRAADPDPGAAPLQTAPPQRTPPQQALVLQPSVGLEEIYTDNVDLSATDRVSDLISRLYLSLDATLDTARSQGHLDGSVGYDFYARQSFRSGFYGTGNGAASYALVPDLLTLKADASTADGALSIIGYSATDRRGAPDVAQLTTFDVGPELSGRTPDGLEVKAAARFTQILYSNASGGPLLLLPSNDSIGQFTAAVATDASRPLQLENSAEYLRDTQDFTTVSDIQSVIYRVGAFGLIGRVGYDYITQDQLHISAPTGSVGFEYKPNNSSTLTVETGSRYNRPAWTANATIEFSPRLLATAAYVEEVEPDQVGVARSYFAFTQAPLILPPPLVPTSFGVPPNVANATSFARTATFRGAYHDDANSLSVSGSWADREYLTIPGQDKTLVIDAAYTRTMRPDLSLTVHADYGRSFESPTFPESTAIGGTIELAYRLNSHTDLTLNFSRSQTRQLGLGGELVTENAVYETIRRAF